MADKPKIKIDTRRIEIHEATTGGGWMVEGKRYKTAFGAQKALIRASKQRVKNTGISEALAIDWHPKTEIGTRVVRSITSVGKVKEKVKSKKGGLLGLGTALVGAGIAAKKAYDENENKQ